MKNESLREIMNQIGRRDTVFAACVPGKVTGQPVQINRAAGGEERIKSLCEQRTENAAENIAGTAFCHCR